LGRRDIFLDTRLVSSIVLVDVADEHLGIDAYNRLIARFDPSRVSTGGNGLRNVLFDVIDGGWSWGNARADVEERDETKARIPGEVRSFLSISSFLADWLFQLHLIDS
jgi:hypothetical protein